MAYTAEYYDYFILKQEVAALMGHAHTQAQLFLTRNSFHPKQEIKLNLTSGILV